MDVLILSEAMTSGDNRPAGMRRFGLPVQQQFLATMTFVGASVNHTDFLPHSLDSMSLSKRPPPASIRHFPFDGTTTSSEDYKHWTLGDPVRSAKPGDTRINYLVPFDGLPL